MADREPEIFIFFCEDVRQEEGNRSSLMGLFGPKILMPNDRGVVKGLVGGALCRFYGNDPISATFSVEMYSDRTDIELPPSQPPFTILMEPPANDGVWTSNIFSGLIGLSVHIGMRIRASLHLLGKTYSAEVMVDRQG